MASKLDKAVLRRAKIAKTLITQPGIKNRELGKMYGVSTTTIESDRKSIRQMQKHQVSQADLDAVVAEEIERCKEIISEAFAEWERSKAPAVEVKVTEVTKEVHKPGPMRPGRPSKPKQTITKGRVANPQYLKIVLDAQERLLRLYGYDPSQLSTTEQNVLVQVFAAAREMGKSPESLPPVIVDVEKTLEDWQ